MTKNSGGGNKAKKQGRKHVNAPKQPSRLRVAVEDGEVYACVQKHFGNGRCQVLCIDGSERQCIIRNKFRGRSRRDNLIHPGSWVLVGEREWEKDGKGTCDLLEVYSHSEIERLKQTVSGNWYLFNGIGTPVNPDEFDDEENGFLFSSRGGGGGGIVDEDFLQDIEETTQKIESILKMDDGKCINIDDI